MNRKYIDKKIASVFLVSLMFLSPHLFSQNKTHAFKLIIPEERFKGCLYDSVHFIDAREDSVNMGFVQLGLMNARANVVFKPSLAIQLSSFAQNLSDSSNGHHELFFQLRKIRFSELTETFSEKGYFALRASLLEKRDSAFFKIASIDTIVLVKSFDVTKFLMKSASSVITGFITQNLNNAGADSLSYLYEEVYRPDHFEKSKIKLYTTQVYTDGLYRTYSAFAAQRPDDIAFVSEKKGTIKFVQYKDSSGKLLNVKPKDIYAIVYKGLPYVATSYGYYSLLHDGDDFYFTGKVRNSVDPMAGIMFGLIGSLLSSTNTSTCYMKLDHSNGSFIIIRVIPDSDSAGL